MNAATLSAPARRVVIRAAGIGGADLVSQGVRVLMIVGPIGFWNTGLLLAEIAHNGLAVAFGVALALEICEVERLQRHPVLRWTILAVASALAVAVSCMLVSTIVSVKIGLAASEQSLRLHTLWNNSIVAVVAIAYLTRRRDSAQAERRRRLMERRLSQTRQRLTSISGRTAEARLEPQMLFDCLTRARDVYPVDMRRGDALLDNLVHYLRMTLGTGSGHSSTLAQAAALAAARVEVERCESDIPMALHVDAETGTEQFPADLLAPLACEWLRHPDATTPRGLRLDAVNDAKSLRVCLEGPCPVPVEVLRRARKSLIDFAAARATVTVDRDSVHLEIAHA